MAKTDKTIDFVDGTQKVLAKDGPRLGGFFIDAILIAIVNSFVFTGDSKLVGAIVIFALYCTSTIATWGTTLGGKAVGLAPVDSTTGARPSWVQSAQRGLGYFLVELPAGFGAYFLSDSTTQHSVSLTMNGVTTQIVTSSGFSLLHIVVAVISTLVTVTGLIWIDIDKKKRTWYDLFAHTVVVRTR